MTSGLSTKRSSAVASGTTSTSSPRMACAQKACSRGVDRMSRPTAGLEPLPRLVDQRDQRDRRAEDRRGQPRQPVEGLLGPRCRAPRTGAAPRGVPVRSRESGLEARRASAAHAAQLLVDDRLERLDRLRAADLAPVHEEAGRAVQAERLALRDVALDRRLRLRVGEARRERRGIEAGRRGVARQRRVAGVVAAVGVDGVVEAPELVLLRRRTTRLRRRGAPAGAVRRAAGACRPGAPCPGTSRAAPSASAAPADRTGNGSRSTRRW